jgi:molecular chaperone DnaJ
VRGGGTGDLMCTVTVETPVSLTKRQKELLREFGDTLSGGDGRHSPEATGWLDRAKKFIDQHLKP